MPRLIADNHLSQESEVIGRTEMIWVWHAGTVCKMAVSHTQFGSDLIHKIGKPDLTTSDVLSQRHCGIVA